MFLQQLETMARFRRRRLLRHALVRAAVVLLVLLALTALADVFAGIPLAARWITLAAAVAVSVWEFGRSGGWRALRTDAAEAARICEAAHPEQGQTLRTALELAGGKNTASPPLAQALLDRAFQQIRGLDHRRLLTPAGWKKAAAGAGAALAVWVVLVSVWPDFRVAALRSLGMNRGFSRVALKASEAAAPRQPVRVEAAVAGRPTASAVLHWRAAGEREWRTEAMTAVAARRFDTVLTAGESELECYAVSGDSASPVLRIPVRVPARASVVRTVITPPAYLAEAVREQDKGDIDAPEDSAAEVTLAFSRPVTSARLVPSQGPPVAVTMGSDSRQGTAKLSVPAGSLTWHVTGQDAAGHAVESDTWQLTGRGDNLPSVRLLEPVDETSATAIWELPARLRAKDDHGLARVGIMLRVAGQEKPLLEKEFDPGNVREAAEMATLALDSMPLGITDNVQVFAWATDRKPRPGNARSVTPIANIDIRQFQIRKLDAPPCECAGECLNLVEKMISAQRHVLSDSFQLKETAAWREVSLNDTQPLAGREMEVVGDSDQLLAKMEEAASSGFDLGKDKGLATGAREHATQAVSELQSVALAAACDHEDKALTNLLQLRREIMKKMSKGGKQSKPKKKDEDRPPSLGELARRLDKAADEEKDVAGQAARLAEATPCPEPLRGQQAATVTELGDIAGELDRHQGLSRLALERMDHSEAAATAAGEQLTARPPEAVEPLRAAEAQIRELAAHLRLLENQVNEQSLAQMEKSAREAAKALEACAACQGACQSGGAHSASAGGAGKSGASPKDARDQKDAKDSDSKDPEPGGSDEKMSPAKARQLAGRSATLHDVLSGGRKTDAAGNPANSGGPALAKEALPDPSQTKELAEGMAAWAKAVEAKSAGPQPEEANEALAKQSGELAAKQQQLAESLTQSLAAARQAQAEKLQALRRETQVRQQQAQARQVAAANGGSQANPGDPGSASGQAQNGSGNGEGNGNGNGSGGDSNNGADVASNRNGLAPDGQAQPQSASPALTDAEYLKRLAATGDEELKQVIPYLTQTPSPDPGVFPFIDQRLTALLAQFSRTAFATRQSGQVPPALQRTVDDYFRSLSDDLGDDDDGDASRRRH